MDEFKFMDGISAPVFRRSDPLIPQHKIYFPLKAREPKTIP